MPLWEEVLLSSVVLLIFYNFCQDEFQIAQKPRFVCVPLENLKNVLSHLLDQAFQIFMSGQVEKYRILKHCSDSPFI